MRIIGAFSPGFERIMPRALARELGAAPAHLSVRDGLVRFDSSAPAKKLARIPCLASAWAVFCEFDGSPSFAQMVYKSPAPRLPKDFRGASFRVRFMRNGRLAPVDAQLASLAERSIAHATGLRSSRTGADSEFWYVVRSEGGGFFGMLLSDPSERKPEKGELRPSLAAAIAELGGVKNGDVVLDCFAGHGSLPAAAMKLAKVKTVCVERDRELVGYLRRRFSRTEGVRIVDGDARALPLDDDTVDLVLTDPPWGIFKEADDLDGLYRASLEEMARVLKPTGRAVVLTARELGLWKIAGECGFNEKERVDTLVGGKKATAHLLVPKHT